MNTQNPTPDATATPRTDAFYVVTAYRWGQRNAHSFVVGAYIGVSAAIRCAEEYADYRGGKYACEVVKAWAWGEDEDCVGNQVHYIESPYYGLAHDGGHFHPADCSKRGRPSAKPFTVRELQNRVGDLERELTAAKAEIAVLRAVLAKCTPLNIEERAYLGTLRDRETAYQATIDALRAEVERLGQNLAAIETAGSDEGASARMAMETVQLRARVAELESQLSDCATKAAAEYGEQLKPLFAKVRELENELNTTRKQANDEFDAVITRNMKLEQDKTNLIHAAELLLEGYIGFGGHELNNGPRMMRAAIDAARKGAT